jgi:hypothetical protein
MMVKDEHANPKVESGVEEGTLISAQLEPIVILATTTPNLAIANEDTRVDVRVEEIEAIIMEELGRECN